MPFGLAFGKITVLGPAGNGNHGDAFNLWLILAILVIAAGIKFCFASKVRQPRAVLICSLVALALIYICTQRYSKDNMIAEAARSGNSNSMDQAALSMVQVDWQFGYWCAVLSLIVSAGMAWAVTNDSDVDMQRLRSKASDGPAREISGEDPPPVLSRTCPECGRRFGGDVLTCPTDGEALA